MFPGNVTVLTTATTPQKCEWHPWAGVDFARREGRGCPPHRSLDAPGTKGFSHLPGQRPKRGPTRCPSCFPARDTPLERKSEELPALGCRRGADPRLPPVPLLHRSLQGHPASLFSCYSEA